MSPADTLVTLAALWLVAVVTPGPNVLFFTSLALSSPKRSVIAAGAGIVLGTAAWGLAGLFGLLWLFEVFPALAVAVKALGGAYLAWIGFRILWGSLRPPAPAAALREAVPLSPMKAFSLAVATNLSNPKSLVFVTSLFAVTHLAEAPLAVGLAGVAIMTAMSTGYYCLYGLLLRLTPVARREGRLKRAVGVLIGAALMGFGVRMALER
ncbi:MAG TPA: LysE family transporter [Beijerinckiaceae bacterium]|jgi:threonine/homoserine/homoserine lactone efflux protein|nr:LysE family translocator [Microvirga sp.]HZB37380.1 LysE family transporter [Beijerinckiaceae bacterium]